MAPNDEHRAIAKALIDEMVNGDDTHLCKLTKEERSWVSAGVEHFDHKNWPLLGDFIGILRKAVLIVVLSVILALIWQGVGASASKFSNQPAKQQSNP